MTGKTLNTSENDDANVLLIKALLIYRTNLKLDLKFGQMYSFSFKLPNISGEIYPYADRFRPKALLCLDAVDGILGSGAPALEKCCQQIDGEHDDQGEQQWH